MRTKKIDDYKLVEMLKQGKQQKEIAHIMGVSEPAISQRLKKLLPPPDSLKDLTEKEQKFIIAKAKGKTNTDAALASYEATSRESAKSIGSQLMDRPEIRKAIDDLMELRGIGREFRIDKLGQHMKNRDPNVSLKALDLGFKLANDFPPLRSFNLNANVDITPVDLSKYRNKE
jgi:predicted transcriptional regulator